MSSQTAATVKINRMPAIGQFIHMLADKKSATAETLLREMGESDHDNTFSFTIPNTPLDEIKGLAIEAFGEKMVTFDEASASVRIDSVYIIPVTQAITALEKPLAPEAAVFTPKIVSASVPKDASVKASDPFIQMIFALCDATGLPPMELAMKINSRSSENILPMKNQGLKDKLKQAVADYLEASRDDSEKAEIEVRRDSIRLNTAAARSIEHGCTHLPDHVEYEPTPQSFDRLERLLAANRGKTAFFDHFMEVGSRGVDEIETVEHQISNEDKVGADYLSPKGVEVHKLLPRRFIELQKNIDEALTTLKTAQRLPTNPRLVYTLGLQLDTVRADLEAIMKDNAAAQRKNPDFKLSEDAAEWLDDTLAAMRPELIAQELAARKSKGSANAVT